MNFANRAAVLVLIAGVGWLGGCTKAGPVDRQSNYWQRVATHLQPSMQPREQALAAHLFGMSLPEQNDDGAAAGLKPVSPATMASAKALIAKASKSEDPVALSLALQAASQTGDDAIRITTARRWLAVEPDNLAPRLHTDASIEELLANARNATRYENHAYGQIRLMTSVFGRWPMTKEETGHGYSKDFSSNGDRAAVNAFSIWAAFGIPPFQKIVNACKGEALASTPTRREDCLHVAKVMVGSSNDAISKSIGIVLLERAATSAEDTAWPKLCAVTTNGNGISITKCLRAAWANNSKSRTCSDCLRCPASTTRSS